MSFARDRERQGLFFPIAFHTKDKWIQLLPGDDLYPKDVDFQTTPFGNEYRDITAEELRSQVKNLKKFIYLRISKNIFNTINKRPN